MPFEPIWTSANWNANELILSLYHYPCPADAVLLQHNSNKTWYYTESHYSDCCVLDCIYVLQVQRLTLISNDQINKLNITNLQAHLGATAQSAAAALLFITSVFSVIIVNENLVTVVQCADVTSVAPPKPLVLR